jgi:hypothetical protein
MRLLSQQLRSGAIKKLVMSSKIFGNSILYSESRISFWEFPFPITAYCNYTYHRKQNVVCRLTTVDATSVGHRPKVIAVSPVSRVVSVGHFIIVLARMRAHVQSGAEQGETSETDRATNGGLNVIQ